MYYQSQVRNLSKQAELERGLAGVIFDQHNLYSKRSLDRPQRSYHQPTTRHEEDQQRSLHLARSRIEAQLQASSVSTNAILNRSRIESALQVRQRNQQLNSERERSMIQHRYFQNASLAAEEEIHLERERLDELQMMKQVEMREDLYRKIRSQEEERIQYELRQAEFRRQVYEEEIKRELRERELDAYDTLRRHYPYY